MKKSNHPVYTYHNTGSISVFNPQARIGDQTELDFYLDIVAKANRPDVFILNHKGKEVPAGVPHAV